MNTKLFSSIILTALSTYAFAEIRTDGSTGIATTLIGPTFDIGSELGEQVGGNLFHSFSEFSIDAGEVANFTGPSSVNNILGRVTGGSISTINGTIQSSITDANLYLINPNGIIFGKDAQLDIQGSFNATTANNLTFSDGSTFSASPSSSDVLTVAPISSFGFLDSTPGNIQVNAESMSVASGKDFNLIGGNINISIDELGRDGISASNGNINIISTAGSSDIAIKSANPTLGNQTGGTINLFGNSRLSTNTRNSLDAGNINIEGHDVVLSDKAKVNSDTFNVGNAGSISVNSHNFMMFDTSDLSTSTFRSGNAGEITLNFAHGLLSDDSFINSTSYRGSGDAGGINITASETLTLKSNSTIKSTANSGTTGNGGDITISTKDLSITGNGDTDGDNSAAEDSALISSNVLSDTTGTGGNVTITTDNLSMQNGATIAVASAGSGVAGDINIAANSRLEANSSFISAKSATADGGNITLDNISAVDLQDSQVTASVASGTGDGGNVFIFDVGGIALQNTHITADSGGAFGGNLNIEGTLVRDPYSTTTARGENVALDGEVLIANEINPNNVLNELRLDFFVNQIKDPCSVVIAESDSSLTIKNSYNSVPTCNR